MILNHFAIQLLAHDIEFQCVLNDAKGVKGVDDRSRAGAFNARLGGQTAGD